MTRKVLSEILNFEGVINLPQNTTSQLPQDTKIFLENIIDEAGLQLTPQLKEAMIGDLYNKLEKKLIADAIENLKPEDVDEFVEVVRNSRSQTEIQKFVEEKLPNAKEIFMESLIDFRTYFLGGTMVPNTPQA